MPKPGRNSRSGWNDDPATDDGKSTNERRTKMIRWVLLMAEFILYKMMAAHYHRKWIVEGFQSDLDSFIKYYGRSMEVKSNKIMKKL
jgi:hypothetical protein